MATTSSAVSHSVNEKSPAIGIGRCDFAPAWLKLAHSTSSSSSSSQPRLISNPSSSAHPSYSTPRARTPNGFDFEHPHHSHHHPPSRSTTSSSSLGVNRAPAAKHGGPRLAPDGAGRNGGGSGALDRGYSESHNQQNHHPYVRRQKSLDSFGARHDSSSGHRSSPPPARSDGSSRGFDSSFRAGGGSRGGRGRSSYDGEDYYSGHSKSRHEDEHGYGTQRSRGRQTNGSTPSTNPNYFYYGTPPTPPNDPIEPRYESDDEHVRSETAYSHRRDADHPRSSSNAPRSNGYGGDAGGAATEESTASFFERRLRRGSSVNGDANQGEASNGASGFGGRNNAGNGSSYSRDLKRHSSGGFESFGSKGGARFESGASMDGAIGYWEEADDGANRKREPPPPDAEEEFPSLAVTPKASIRAKKFLFPAAVVAKEKKRRICAARICVVDSAAVAAVVTDWQNKCRDFWEGIERRIREGQSDRGTVCCEGYCSGRGNQGCDVHNNKGDVGRGGSNDGTRCPGIAIWLGKQNSQTIVSSSSTRVQLKQQHMSGSGSGSTGGGAGGVSNGSLVTKSLMPPKMSRPTTSSTATVSLRSSIVSSGSGSGAKASNGTSASTTVFKEPSTSSAPALMDIPRFVKPVKGREEKKSEFLRALRDPHSRHAKSRSAAGSTATTRLEEEMEDVFVEEDEEEVYEQSRKVEARSRKVDGGNVSGVAKAVEELKMEGKKNGKEGWDGIETAPAMQLGRLSSPPSLQQRRRRPSSSSSGASLPSAEDSNLSSSLEAEQRLLREMGWEEDEEEDDDWQISEDELREVQLKIQEFHKNQHRSLTPLTLNVVSPVCNDGVRMSTSEGCTPTEPEGPTSPGMTGSSIPISATAYVISGFENNNEGDKASTLIRSKNPEVSGDVMREEIFAGSEVDDEDGRGAWNLDSERGGPATKPTPEWQSTVAEPEDTDSDLSDVDSD